jgi:Ca-activated chloride channel family protein
LLKNCFIYFVQQKIDARDKVAIVTYAGSTQVLLEPTSGSNKDKIIAKLQKLSSGGSTNGEGGIKKSL